VNTVEKWLTGVTTLAIVATLVASKYTAGILTSGGKAIASVYQGAKK
jgi:hypothetical protein